MSKNYPYITECTDCGERDVPIPLSDFPVDVEDFSAALMAMSKFGCTKCSSKNLTVTQSPEAYAWYDENVREDG